MRARARASAPLGEQGLTLIEAIVAIVLIGIALPTLIVPFSGMSTLKQPEYHVQAGFWGMRQMEGLRNETYARMPAAGTYTCAGFQTSATPNFDIDCTSVDYTFNWEVEDVAANALDTGLGSPDFGKKVTLTIARVDGELGNVQFFTLF